MLILLTNRFPKTLPQCPGPSPFPSVQSIDGSLSWKNSPDPLAEGIGGVAKILFLRREGEGGANFFGCFCWSISTASLPLKLTASLPLKTSHHLRGCELSSNYDFSRAFAVALRYPEIFGIGTLTNLTTTLGKGSDSYGWFQGGFWCAYMKGL